MTLNEALVLAEGAIVTHPAKLDYTRGGAPVKAPIRVTKVWINEKRTIVLIRSAAIGGAAWLDATAYDFPPKGQVYDRLEREWVTTAEMKLRKKERHSGVKIERESAA